MSVLPTQQSAKEVVLKATVIRANGEVEELGTIAYWHKNPLRRLLHRLRHGKTGSIST